MNQENPGVPTILGINFSGADPNAAPVMDGKILPRRIGEANLRLRDLIGDEREAEEAQERGAQFLETLPWVADAIPHSEILSTAPPADSFVRLYRNSYYEGRWADSTSILGVEVRMKPNHMLRTDPRGVGHGSPYMYDRHVPIIFMGPGIQPGVSAEPVRTVDLAPTLSAFLGIPYPEDLDGRVLINR